MKFVVQVFAPSGSVSSSVIDASDAVQARTLANKQATLPDEDGTATIKIVDSKTGLVAASSDIAITASAAGKAKAAALAARLAADGPALKIRQAQFIAAARARAVAAGAPVVADIAAVKGG